MFGLRPHSLTSKFLLRLSGVIAAMAVLFLAALNLHMENLLRNETRQKAELILAQVGAVQDYIRTILRPAMFRTLPEDRFVLEAMSTSFTTRWVMSDLNQAKEAFRYRRVAVDARNPDYEADALERGFLERFQTDRNLLRIEQFLKIGGHERYALARPQYFEPSCLRCHGDPAAAPRELIEIYGDVRGFGRKAGDLAGMDLVTVKMEAESEGIREAILSFAVLFAAGTLVLFAVIQVFFTRLVAHNLGRVSGLMRERFPDEAGPSPASTAPEEDEIEGIIRGFEVFADRLGQARAELKDHAATLEERVAKRTADLFRVAEERRADVDLFVNLLDGLNRSQGKPALLKAALPLLARRFGADQAAYFCVLSGSDYAVWPPDSGQPTPPPDWTTLVTEDEPRLTPSAWHVPVQASESGRGLLCLFWQGEHPAEAGSAGLAQALGRLMGIAMDSLDALDAVLRQNTLLSSIFEGIGDPLLLLDRSGGMLLANSSARRLARDLDPDEARGMERLTALVRAHSPAGGEVELPPERSFNLELYRLEHPQGQTRTVAVLRETTAEKRLAAQMSRQERLAAVGELAAGLAHEINNPLGVITCYADLIRPALSDPQAQADLEVIHRHCAQAQKVVRDLLDFARPKAMGPGPTDLNLAASTVLEVFRPKARKAGTELVFTPAPDLPPAQAGRDALEHILANLLLNALDAVIPGQGRVEVSTAREASGNGSPPGLVLTVRDNGPGVPADLLHRIFDPFFTTKDVGKGTGLGLAVVYGLARDLGGRVDVESDHGAAFAVTLPAAQPAHTGDTDGIDPGR